MPITHNVSPYPVRCKELHNYQYYLMEDISNDMQPSRQILGFYLGCTNGEPKIL